MTTTEENNPSANRLRAIFSATTLRSIPALPRQLVFELSTRANGATVAVSSREKQLALIFELMPGDTLFARAGKRITAIGNLWDDHIQELIDQFIIKTVAAEFPSG